MARTRVEGTWRPEGATALMLLLDHGPCWDAPIPLNELTRSLVALGVDVNATDAAGRTALFGVERADLVDLLLALGARADVRDRAGRSPLFYASSERVLLTLLDAGADPRGRLDGDAEGLTLRQIAVRGNMQTLLARLRAWRPVRR